MKIGFLYAGQGSQKVGMGQDFYQQYPVYREVVDSFSSEYRNVMHDGPMEQLSETTWTQPCMALFAAGITQLLKAENINPNYALGLSLGEYGALYGAGVWDLKTYIEVTAYRGLVMTEAAKGLHCKMIAVLNFDRTKLEEICKVASSQGYVSIVNYNYAGQYVICGEEEAVEAARQMSLDAGAKRCIPLQVSGPFHTPFMKSAGDKLQVFFEQIHFHQPACKIMSNASGTWVNDVTDVPDLLVKQVQSSVYFEDNLRLLIEEKPDLVIEIGPGKVLSGFLKKMAPSIKCMSIESVKDFEQVVNALKEV